MVIAIDIRALMHPGYSGIHTYIQATIEELFSKNKEDSIILFSNNGSRVSPIEKKWERENIRYIHTSIPNKIFSFLLRFGILKMDQWIERKSGQKIDILWIPDPRPFSCSKKTILVSTFHDLTFVHYNQGFTIKTKLFQLMSNPKKLAKVSDHIIAVSEFTKQDLIDTYYIKKEKITVIYEGGFKKIYSFEGEDYKYLSYIKEKYHLPERFFLTLGTIEPRKNLQQLTQAFSQEKRYYLVIAGGPNKHIFKKAGLFFSENILYIGNVEDKEKHALYFLCEGLLFPSFFEGFGLPIVEAMSYKKSVFTSNTSSLPEIAGKRGFYTNPYDYIALQQDLHTYISNTDLRENLSKKSHPQIENFSWDISTQKTLSLFYSLLGKIRH